MQYCHVSHLMIVMDKFLGKTVTQKLLMIIFINTITVKLLEVNLGETVKGSTVHVIPLKVDTIYSWHCYTQFFILLAAIPQWAGQTKLTKLMNNLHIFDISTDYNTQ